MVFFRLVWVIYAIQSLLPQYFLARDPPDVLVVYVRVEAFDRSLRLFWASTFGSYFMPKVEGPLTVILGENKAIFSLQCLFSKLNQLEDSLQNQRNDNWPRLDTNSDIKWVSFAIKPFDIG